jgi:NitT/TauT family transport system substrate-binding protein
MDDVFRKLVNRLSLGILLALCAISGAHAQGSALIPVKFRLDWVWQAPQSIWTLAHERGYFKDEGLEVAIDRGYGGPENVATVATGQYDFVFGDFTSLMLVNDKNPAQKLISVFVVYDAYLGTIITRKGNGINTPKDLEGRVIGAPLTTGGRTMFPAFAKANGIDQSKITWDTIGIQLQDSQFAQGKFDAIAGFATTSLPNLMQLGISRDKLTVFNFVDYGVDLYGTGLIVREEFTKSNPEVVRKFLRATMRGMKAMMADKVAAIESLKKRDPLLDTKIEVDRLNMMIEMALKTPTVEKFGVSHVEEARLQRYIDTIASVSQLTRIPKPAEVYTDQFLPPAEDLKLKF